MKNKYFKYLIQSIVILAIIFGYYVLTSNGLGNKPFYLQLRRFASIATLFTIFINVLAPKVNKEFFYSFTITSVLWATVYPITYKLTYNSTMPFFSNHFDIVFALYTFMGLSSLAYLLCKYFSNIIATVISSTVQFIMLLLPLSQLVYYATFGTCVSEAAVTAIYQTNLAEAKEFLLQTFGYIGCVMSLVLSVILYYLLYRLNTYGFRTISKSDITSKRSIVFLLLLAIVGNVYAFGNSFRQTGIMTVAINVHNYFKKAGEFNIYHQERYNKLVVAAPNKPFSKPSTIIFVIGESASRTFMSAYNPLHQRDTTPWLREQKSNPNFILFPHAYSSRFGTVPSLERALTEKNQYNNIDFNKSTTIIDIAKKAGYHTIWFSNQGTIDVADTPITLVGKTADSCKWTNEDPASVQYDGALLSYLKTVNPNQNNFIILHFMGSHDNFQNRYPVEFAKWGNPNINEPILNYDNSLYYSDYVLSQIYEYSKKHLNLQAMVYMSDHGNVPDHKRHPDKSPFTALRIPLFVYVSDEYRDIYPETYHALEANRDKYFTNDLTYDLLCGILNVKSPNYDETQSLASPHYKYTRETLRTNLGTMLLTDDIDEK